MTTELYEHLTPRETQILRKFALGYAREDVAKVLDLTPTGLKWHLQNIYGKLQVNNAAGAVVRAAQAGVVAIEPLEGES